MDEVKLVKKSRKREKYFHNMVTKDSLILEISSPYGPIVFEEAEYNVLGLNSLFMRGKETYPKEMEILLPQVEGFDWSKPSAVEKKMDKALAAVATTPGITSEQFNKIKNGVVMYNSIKLKALEIKMAALDEEIKYATDLAYGEFKDKQ